MRCQHLRNLFADDPARGERMTAEAAGIFLDFSKNRIDDETLRLLVELAEQLGLRAKIDSMFRGEKINVTENRSALHVALRAPKGTSIVVDGKNVVPEVHAVLDKMAAFAHRIRSGQWTGHTGKRIRNVVNIGIGGSDLGPVMAYEALKHYSDRDMVFRFVSNIDATDFVEATHDLDAAETLFIISSKTFTTLETMTNAQSARDWSLGGLGGDLWPRRELAGADRIHVDVMDGHFVPNLSMGAPIIRSLRKGLPLETHLMILNPDFFVDAFTQAGTDLFLVHWEGNNDLSRTVQRIKALGKRVGVAINPATPAVVLEEIFQDLDQVLVMTVNPGFGHQHFLHTTLPKIRRAREMIDQIKPECGLEVDGGIDATTAPLAVAAGANVLVAGTAIFNDSEGITAAMRRLRAAIQR